MVMCMGVTYWIAKTQKIGKKSLFGGTSDSEGKPLIPPSHPPQASVTTTTQCNNGEFHEYKNEYSMVRFRHHYHTDLKSAHLYKVPVDHCNCFINN